jgi:hypothetical protein
MAQRNRKNKTQINLSTITLELQTTAKPALTQETGRIAQPVITGFQRGIPRPDISGFTARKNHLATCNQHSYQIIEGIYSAEAHKAPKF